MPWWSAITLFMVIATTSRRLVPGRTQSMAEMSYEFVADMIHSAAGEAGYRFFPFVFAIFMFVLACNFFGLIPGVFTVTSQIAVTFSLAALVILTVILTGFATHGIGFLKLFVPKAPFILLILLVPIEIISFLTRPISLSVRLFANMLAGHTMLKVFAGFVVALGGAGGIFSVLSIAPMLLIIAVVRAGISGGVSAGLCLRDPDLHLPERSAAPPRSSLNNPKELFDMDLAAAKMIGAGLACIALVGAGIGIGNRVRQLSLGRAAQSGCGRQPDHQPAARLRAVRSDRPVRSGDRAHHPVHLS